MEVFICCETASRYENLNWTGGVYADNDVGLAPSRGTKRVRVDLNHHQSADVRAQRGL